MNVPEESKVASAAEVRDMLLTKLDAQGVRKDVVEALVTEVKDLGAGEIKRLDVTAEMAKEQLNRLIADNQARKRFSQWIFAVTVIWMFCVLMIVIQCARGNFHLSDGVMIALITTTTANVFGFFYVVVNYLFNRNKST